MARTQISATPYLLIVLIVAVVAFAGAIMTVQIPFLPTDDVSGSAVIPGACNDSDGGFNIRTKGSAVDANGISTDYCKGNDLYEFYCTGNHRVAYKKSCGNLSCVDGACTATQRPSCIDTDGGNNIYVYGKANATKPDGNWIASYDRCWGIDGQTLSEEYCQDGVLMSDPFVNCTYGCSQGQCLRNQPICTSTDPDNDIYTKGYSTIDGGLTKIFDQCGSAQGYNSTTLLLEAHCDGSRLRVDYSTYCANGCFDGACVNQPSEGYYSKKQIDAIKGYCAQLCEKITDTNSMIEFCGKMFSIDWNGNSRTANESVYLGKWVFCEDKIPCFILNDLCPSADGKICRNTLVNEQSDRQRYDRLAANGISDSCGLPYNLTDIEGGVYIEGVFSKSTPNWKLKWNFTEINPFAFQTLDCNQTFTGKDNLTYKLTYADNLTFRSASWSVFSGPPYIEGGTTYLVNFGVAIGDPISLINPHFNSGYTLRSISGSCHFYNSSNIGNRSQVIIESLP